MEISFEQYVATELAPKLAAKEKPSILLLTCMDYRYAHRITNVMDSLGLRRQYDMFVLAGAAAGATQDETWRRVLVQHIRVAREIDHPIDQIIIFEHRDCGAYRKFFGLEWNQVTPPVEEASHKKEVELLIEYLKKEFATDIPNLVIKSWLLARDEDDALVQTRRP
jgi:carbonic anhydrase